MRYTTIENKKREALSALQRAYRDAEYWCHPAAKLHDNKNKAKAIIATCPRYVRSWLDGYDQALFDRHLDRGPDTILSFGYLIYGTFYTCDRALPETDIPIVSPERGDISHEAFYHLTKEHTGSFYYRKDLTKPF